MAEEATQAKAQAAEAPPAKKDGRGKLIIVVAVVLLLAGGGAAWWFGLLPYGAPAEATEKRPEVGALLALDPFIANLADEDGERYLKATVQVEFLEGKIPPEVNARLPQVRDLLLTLLTSKRFSEIRTPQGKALLREEIINRLNRALRRDVVKAVYFTEFIVQ
jgi:flagellar FliL protein